MFLCILIELVCLPLGINRQVQGTLSISPIKKNWDIITRWPSLKIPDIPFLKTLILKFFWHGLWIPLQGTTFSGPYLEPPSPKILCPQKTVPRINCLSVLQEKIRKEFESALPGHPTSDFTLFWKILGQEIMMFVISWTCFLFVSQEELSKEFFGTTLPARLEKFNALLRGPFFLGDKVRHKIVYLH